MTIRRSAAISCLVPALLLAGCSPVQGISTPATEVPTRVPQATIVSLTFDDGDADNFAAAAQLEQSGLHATFYIPSNLVGTPGYMTWDQLQTLQQDGHEIGGHTLDHVNVGELPPNELQHQVCDDRRNLVEHGFNAVSFAYPYGGYAQAARDMVSDCGYLDARIIGAGPDQVPPIDVYQLRAFPYVVADTDATKLQRYVTGTRKEGGGWVILIFHHVCDGCDYFSVKPDVFNRFTAWLVQQQNSGNVQVRTVREVILGSSTP